MKRYTFTITAKRYTHSDIEIFNVVATSIEEAIKRFRVIYRKQHYGATATIQRITQDQEVYV